ncbi:VOC family protein [Aquabacter sp. CN5-332]|uniref:VOC family protein n=1 Tax=Aquabacter sp. CN5-332 TaxID=3156608 RepID=UPI0032B58E86
MHGTFVWYELMTTDMAAAEGFYKNVVGWDTRDSGMPGMSYTLLSTGGSDVGGIMTLPDQAKQMGAPPSWIGYVAVDNVDTAAAAYAAGGGKIYRDPSDIPTVGRFAIVADPQGAVLSLFKGEGEMRPPLDPMATLGAVGWHELLTEDREKAFTFYSGQFGWEKDTAMDMGEMGIYQLWKYAGDSNAIGGMMTRPPGVPASFWMFYFTCDDIDAAQGRVTAGGGQVVNGPMEVPGGAWIFQAMDPQGAMFSMVGPRK